MSALFLAWLPLLVGAAPSAWAAEPAATEAPAADEADTVNPTDGDAAADQATELTMLWAGASGGIGPGAVQFELHERVEDTPLQPSAIEPVHGWLVHGPWAVAAKSRDLADTLRLFGETAPSCGEPREATSLRGPSETLLVEGDRRGTGTDLGVSAALVAARTCTVGEVEALLVGPRNRPEPTFELTRWETRQALAWTLEDGSAADAIGRPVAEGTRRFGVLRRTRPEVDLFVDAGRFVDGVSTVRDNQLSLHRPTAFALLRDLEPDALVPGDTELAAGPAALLEEAPDLPWVATNWSTDDEDVQVLPYRIATTEGGRRVLLLGVVDPRIQGSNPSFKDDGVTLTDPVKAVQSTLDTLRSTDPSSPPDLVVVLTSAESDVLDALRSLRGVDLLIGDRDDEVRRVETLDVTLRRGLPDGAGAGVTLPLDGLQHATLRFRQGGPGVASVRVKPLPVPLSTPPDQATLARVTQVRAEAYPPLEDRLLPSPTPTGATTKEQFDKAMCEAVLDATRGDLALLPSPPRRYPVPGPLTALLVAERLNLPDQLEIHDIPGDRFRRLLDQLYGTVPVTCGAPLGQRFPKARGRWLEDERVYRVITTDRLRTSTVLSGLLSAAHSPHTLDLPGVKPVEDEDGEQLSLRSAVVSSLRRLREEHGDDLLDELLERSPNDYVTQWNLRVRQLSFRLEGYQGVDDEAYSQIPETRATSPSQLTLGTAADVAIETSGARALWDARARAQLTRLRTDDAVQETQDDAKLSSSVTLSSLSIPAGPLAFRPFAEGLLDSEITPTEAEDGTQNPRQADLSLTLGFATPITGALRALRIGVLVLQDVAQLDKRAELGGRLEAQTRLFFGPALVWTTQLDAFVYGDTPDQDASDLRFKVFFQSRLGLPLARWLDLALFGDVFVFQGRVEETSAVSSSFTLGVGLDIGGVFEL